MRSVEPATLTRARIAPLAFAPIRAILKTLWCETKCRNTSLKRGRPKCRGITPEHRGTVPSAVALLNAPMLNGMCVFFCLLVFYSGLLGGHESNAADTEHALEMRERMGRDGERKARPEG